MHNYETWTRIVPYQILIKIPYNVHDINKSDKTGLPEYPDIGSQNSVRNFKIHSCKLLKFYIAALYILSNIL